MKPELQRDGSTQERAAPETTAQQTYRRALRILALSYERIMGELAAEVCETEDAFRTGGNEFVLTELENKFVHRIRDLQTLIGSLRNQLQTSPTSIRVDELRCPPAEVRARLSQWFAEHPGCEIVEVLTHPDGEDVLVLPIYYQA